MTDGPDGDIEKTESAPSFGGFGAEPPVEDSTAARDMMFAPVTKVRGGQRETSVGSEHPGASTINDSDEPQPFHALQDDPVGLAEPSAWSTMRKHPRFKLGAFTIVLVAVLLSGVLAWSVKTGTDAPREEAEQFLDYLNAFDYIRAAAMMDPQCSQGATPELLTGVFAGRNFQHSLVQSDISSSGAVVTGFVDVVGVGEVPVRINLRFTGGDWVICGIGAR